MSFDSATASPCLQRTASFQNSITRITLAPRARASPTAAAAFFSSNTQVFGSGVHVYPLKFGSSWRIESGPCGGRFGGAPLVPNEALVGPGVSSRISTSSRSSTRSTSACSAAVAASSSASASKSSTQSLVNWGSSSTGASLLLEQPWVRMPRVRSASVGRSMRRPDAGDAPAVSPSFSGLNGWTRG